MLMDKTIMELAELLRTPNDIDNKMDSIMKGCINSIEEQNENECEIYDHNLKIVKELVSELKDLNGCLEKIRSLKIDGFNVLKESEINYNGYYTVKTLVKVHENFTLAERFMKEFNSVEDEIDKDNVMKYHSIVFEKEEFLYDLQWYKANLNENDSKKVENKILELKRIIYDFTAFILKIAADFIENCDSFEILNNIVEKEENRDLITIKSNAGVTSNDPIEKQYYLENVKYSVRHPKHLMKKAISVIESSIRSKFEVLRQDKQFYSKLDDVLNDLYKLRSHQLYFFTIDDFIRVYHTNIKDLITFKLLSIDPERILGIIDFKTKYYDLMLTEFGKSYSEVGERLIENEQELYKKYTLSVTEKLKVWIENISIAEVQRFKLRDKGINLDEQGKLVSPGFVNLMQIIKVQLEPVSKHEKVFDFVTKVLIERCAMFKNTIINAIEHEYKLSYDSRGLSGFEDYCIMFGNSGFKIAKYFSSIGFCMRNQVKELQGIFISILKASNNSLCDFVCLTCKPVTEKIFTDDWAEKKLMEQFLVTLDDFLTDYSKTMTEYSFNTFLCDLSERIYLCYRTQLKSSNISLNSASAMSIKDDYNRFVDLFSKYSRERNFDNFLKSLLKLVPLIETTSGEIFMIELKSLILSDSTINKQFVENILDRKNDMIDSEILFVKDKLRDVFRNSKKKKTFLGSIISG